MPHEIDLLYDYLLVGAMLFGIGMVGFLSRRNMIVMFLSAEMMLQGVSVSLVAWSRFHNDFGGQALVDVHHRRGGVRGGRRLGAGGHALPTQRQAGRRRLAGTPRGQPAALLEEPPLEAETESPPAWPHLAPAGVPPGSPPRATRSPPEDLDMDIKTLLILIPALPLAAALLTAVLGKRVLRERSHWPTIVAMALSSAASVMLVFAVQSGVRQNLEVYYPPRFDFGEQPTIGYEKIVTLWTWTAVDNAQAVPSPLGEGWGEGKCR